MFLNGQVEADIECLKMSEIFIIRDKQYVIISVKLHFVLGGIKTLWKYISVTLALAIIGLIFCLSFQSMAYWGPGGTSSMEWYWFGASLSYVFSLVSIILICFWFNKLWVNKFYALLLANILLIVATIFLTTFVIIAWQSGF